MKKRIGLAALFMGLLAAALTFAGADTAMAAKSKAPKIRKVVYDENGEVDVDFKGHVEYGKTKIKVKDSSGKSYKAVITDKDDDDLDFTVKNFKAGKKYTFKITKVRKAGTKKYYTVKGSFKIPAGKKVVVEEVDYDAEDDEVSIDFKSRVSYKNLKVKISDENKNYSVKILKKDNDEIELRVSGLKEGETYSYKITGVAPYGTKKYKTVKGTFIAYDD